MKKILISGLDAPQPVRGFATADEQADPEVATRVVFGDGAAPIDLRLHEMAPGHEVRWTSSRLGHLLYVWEGELEIAGRALGPGGVVVIEHGAGAAIRAKAKGCRVVVFNPANSSGYRPARAGGHVHVLPADRVPRAERLQVHDEVGGALLADSRCDSCEFWLHENSFHTPGFVVEPHYHSEDEIILVIGGEVKLGNRIYGRGTALSVARDTVYGFRSVGTGLAFINFRPSRPSYARAKDADPVDELSFYQELSAPPFETFAAAGVGPR